MAIYHFNAKVITRSVGRSVVAASAYASCSKIYNDYDGVTHDYTKKRGNVYSEIFLSPNAPTEWQEREKLWNAVEAAEKSKDSRLARELVVALPVELELDEQKELLRSFINENCVSKGMCADVNIHDTDGHNPHAHILLTVRPLGKNGKWQAKTQKEYLCKRGDEEKGFTADEFKTAQSGGWEKQYQYRIGKKNVYMTPTEAASGNYERVNKYPKSTRYGRQNPIAAELSSEEQILKWRKAWEVAVNKALEQKQIPDRIDCRSFAERGIDEQPTIHEGVTARVIEKCGFVSEKCEFNRRIKADNRLLKKLKTEVKYLTELVKNSVSHIAAALENLRSILIGEQYALTYNKSGIETLKKSNADIDKILNLLSGIDKDIAVCAQKLKTVKTEKKNSSAAHIIKHKELAAQIAELDNDTLELKSTKADLMRQIGCKTAADVQAVRKVQKQNVQMLEKLTVQNADKDG